MRRAGLQEEITGTNHRIYLVVRSPGAPLVKVFAFPPPEPAHILAATTALRHKGRRS